MKKNTQIIIIVGVVAFITLGAYFLLMFARESPSSKEEENKIQRNDEGEKKSEVDKEEGAITDQAVLEAIGSFVGEGIATRKYDGEKFSTAVRAQLSDPPKEKFYESWLVSNGGSFISTGKLENAGNAYESRFSSDKNLISYKKVVITEETEANGLDGKPETHILKGSFKD